MAGDHVTGKWSYSTDEEGFHGLFDDKEDAIGELQDYSGGEGGWVGQCRRPTPPWKAISADRILEDVNDLEDYEGEWAEDWDRSTTEQLIELNTILQAAAREWFERHDLMPRFWMMDVGTVEKVPPLEEQADE